MSTERKMPSNEHIKARTFVLARGAVRALDWAAPEAAAWAAEQAFCTPVRHARPERERALLAQAERLEVPFSSGALAAWSWGSGPTVLLVHGWEGRGTQLGALVEPLVAKGHRVVALDGPAHGDSPGRQATLLDFAAAVRAAADATGATGIAAHSLGAAATTIALARGARVERVVYLAPASHVRGAIDRFTRLLALSDAARARFLQRIEARTGEPIDGIEGARLAARLRTPLVIIHDVDDGEVPLSDALALAEHWRGGARLSITAGLGHRRLLRDPAVVRTAVDVLTDGEVAPTSADEELSRELFDRERRRDALSAA